MPRDDGIERVLCLVHSLATSSTGCVQIGTQIEGSF